MEGTAARDGTDKEAAGHPRLVALPREVLAAPCLSIPARLLYALIVAESEGGAGRVVLDRLVGLAGASRAEVESALFELARAGLVQMGPDRQSVAAAPWRKVEWGALREAVAAPQEAASGLDPERAAVADRYLAEDERIAKYRMEEVLAYAYRRIGWSEFTAWHSELIMRWVEPSGLGLPPEVVSLLIDECVERGKTHPNYMNRIAERWAAKGIRTVEEARAHTTRYRRRLARYRAVCQRLGWNRPLTEGERRLYDKWTDEWGFSEEVILAACDETTKTDAPSFAYVDAVLQSWREKGVRTVAEARARGSRPPSPSRTRSAVSTRERLVAATEREQDYWGSYYRVLNRRRQGEGGSGRRTGA